jgi:hypothetical protein
MGWGTRRSWEGRKGGVGYRWEEIRWKEGEV